MNSILPSTRLIQVLSLGLICVAIFNIVLLVRAYALGVAPFDTFSPETSADEATLSASLEQTIATELNEEDAAQEYRRVLERLAELRRRESELESQLEEAQLRINPDFEKMKEAALLALRSRVEEGPAALRIQSMRDSLNLFSRYQVDLNQVGYAATLSQLRLDQRLKDRLSSALMERDMRNNVLIGLRNEGQISADELSDLRDTRSDAEIAAAVLDENGVEEFIMARGKTLEATRLNLTASRVINSTGWISHDVQKQLITAYHGLVESYPDYAELTEDERIAYYETRIADIDDLRDSMATSVSPRDLLYADIFLEQERVTSESILERFRQ